MSSDTKPRRFKWLKRFAAAGLLLIGGLTGWWYLLSAELRTELQALRTQGMPTNGAELNEFYRIPRGTPDITPAWMRAITAAEEIVAGVKDDTLPILGSGSTPVPLPGTSWDQLDEARSFLAEHDELLAEIFAACRADGAVRFPVDYKAGIATLLPWPQNSRSIGRLLMLDAFVNAHDEDSAQVLQDVRGLIALTESLRDEPNIMSQLVRMAIIAIATQTLVDVLPTSNWSDDDLLALQESLRAIDIREGARIGLIGERAIGLHEIGAKVPAILYRANVKMALEVYSQALAALDADWQSAIARQVEISQLIQKRASNPLQRLKLVAALMLLPAQEQFVIASARTAAKQRAAICAIAAERHFRQHGQYPASLDSIDQQLLAVQVQQPLDTIDPFTGEPLKYVVSEDSLLIYSVGRDGNDDGGSVERNAAEQQSDVGFLLTFGKVADSD